MKRFLTKLNLDRFFRREDGVALVEFAIFLPLFLLSFFVIVEFARVFFSYQGAVTGVRDAARYMARVAPAGICEDAGGVGGILTSSTTTKPEYVNVSIPGIPRNDAPYQIVWRNIDNEAGLLPTNIFLDDVRSIYRCVKPLGEGTYRQDEVPIVIVSADIRIVLPLIGLIELNGLTDIFPDGTFISHTVIDESRIFGV